MHLCLYVYMHVCVCGYTPVHVQRPEDGIKSLQTGIRAFSLHLAYCMGAVIQTLSLMITEQTFLTPEPSLSPLFFSLSLHFLVFCMFVYLDLSSVL